MRSIGPLLVLGAVLFTAATPAWAGPATKSQPRSVFVMDFDAKGVDEATVDTIEGIVATELARDERLKVIAGNDLRRLLNLEAEKQAAGCAGDDSCIAEIAGALGAEVVLTGQLGRLGSSYLLTLTLIDAGKAEALNRKRFEVKRPSEFPSVLERELPGFVAPAVRGVKRRIGLVWPVVTTALTGTTLLLGGLGLVPGTFLLVNNMTAKSDFEAHLSGDIAREDLATGNRVSDLANARADYDGTKSLYHLAGMPSLWGAAALLTISALSGAATVAMLSGDLE